MSMKTGSPESGTYVESLLIAPSRKADATDDWSDRSLFNPCGLSKNGFFSNLSVDFRAAECRGWASMTPMGSDLSDKRG